LLPHIMTQIGEFICSDVQVGGSSEAPVFFGNHQRDSSVAVGIQRIDLRHHLRSDAQIAWYRLVNSAHVLRHIQHPHIVRLHDSALVCLCLGLAVICGGSAFD
jgi:hypothetical protein